MIFCFIVCVFLILCAIHLSIHWSRAGRLLNKLPGLDGHPIIGNAFFLISTPKTLFYKARLVANVMRNKGNILRAWIFNISVVHVYDPEDLEVLLSSPKFIKKGYVYRFLGSWLKDGLLTSTGEKWQTRRKILTPSFHFNILRQFCKIFVEESKNIVAQLQSEVGKDETELLPHITNFTLNSICETAMGTNMDSNQPSVVKYKKSLFNLGEYLVRRFTRAWLFSDFVYNSTKDGKVFQNLVSTMHEFTTQVIRNRRKTWVDRGDFDFDDTDEDVLVGRKKRMAMLDLLLKAETEGHIDENGIREEVDTFMFEGHDTTRIAITFCLMLLANHQDIQDRIVSELEEIFSDPNKKPTIEDFGKMNYLELCIKESLRLYPSVPFISRHLTEDMHLKKYIVPAGTTMFIHIFDIHRNPNLYLNPDKFDPDRFLPENSRNRHPYAYIPFSAGPRNCIGQRFALLEEKVIISAILRNFKLEPVTKPEDIVFACDLVLRASEPIKFKLIPRKQS